MNFTCAILAGGASVRMGRDKATLTINNKTLIEYTYEKVRGIFKDIIIISNHHEGINGIEAPILKDFITIQNPLVGIASALIYSNTPYVFVLACDMPNISAAGIDYMIKNTNGEDIIIPLTEKGYEPLHALYNRSCIPYMLRLIDQRRFKITNLFPYLYIKTLGMNPCFFLNGESVFININKMEDVDIINKLCLS